VSFSIQDSADIKKTANIESLFDISLNRVSFSIQDSADIIVSMYEKKVLRQMAERTKLKSVI
jgi:hypothetical protein